MFNIGGNSAFALMVPILSGFIAYSIADKPALTPGMVGGMLAVSTGAGFLGGIISGYLAGYLVLFLKKTIKLPKSMQGLLPVLIIPVTTCVVIGLLMIYVIGSPIKYVMTALTNMLQLMSGSNKALLGFVLGAMMSIDMGGPINKVASAFYLGAMSEGIYTLGAACMAGGMVPPIGLALATVIAKNRFTNEEIEAGKAAWLLGASYITEGAIPFAAADLFRVIPSITIGSGVAGALSMFFECESRAPHGRMFIMFVPNIITHLGAYILSIAAGVATTALIVILLKKPIASKNA